MNDHDTKTATSGRCAHGICRVQPPSRFKHATAVAWVCFYVALPAHAQPKSIVIGLDGLGYGARGFDMTGTPRMDSLIDGTWAAGYHGAYSDRAYAGGEFGGLTQQPTVSGPGWTSMVTGVWANKHDVYGNSFASPNVANYPAYLGTAKSAANSLQTATILWWQIYNDSIFEPINNDGDPNNDLDHQYVFPADSELTAETVEILDMDGVDDFDADLTFVELGDLDFAGHSCGSSGACYETELMQQDFYVGQMLDAIIGRPNFANEDWQIVLTSDHGHLANGGHGGHSDLERRIPFIVSSKSLDQGILPLGVSQVDVAPTVLEHFGITPPAGYDGISRATGAMFCLFGDLNDDCLLDGSDWLLYVDGLGGDYSNLTPEEAYLRGDLDGDFLNNHADFLLFRHAYEDNNGVGSFAEMVANIPEPATLSMGLLALVGMLAFRRR